MLRLDYIAGLPIYKDNKEPKYSFRTFEESKCGFVPSLPTLNLLENLVAAFHCMFREFQARGGGGIWEWRNAWAVVVLGTRVESNRVIVPSNPKAIASKKNEFVAYLSLIDDFEHFGRCTSS